MNADVWKDPYTWLVLLAIATYIVVSFIYAYMMTTQYEMFAESSNSLADIGKIMACNCTR